MNEQIKDGGPAFICSKCAVSFIPRAWQTTSRDYRCLSCKRAQQNERNAANPEAMRARARTRYSSNKSYWRDYAKSLRDDPAYKEKRAARRKVATEIEAGRLTRLPCEVCGEAKTDAHHEDYSKPLDVRWLCHACHIKHEKELTHAVA